MSKSRDDQSASSAPSSDSPRAGASRRQLLLGGTAIFAVGALPTIAAQAQQPKRPNVLVIMGDDIGQSDISAYTFGLMGYHTPNIDRIANEGMKFTDYYAEQSCTAGRSSFITGQATLRTGLSKVGIPGATIGLQPEDITIAEALKPLGYVTGQFGKNHLGDRDEFLPTVHGFDEFFGNLYHLNAEEEPENPDYPKNPDFKAKFGPRGVLHSWAKPDGTQEIKDTGPLTRKRMETMDEEITAGALDFIERQHKAGKPFFCWWNSTRMHVFTHLKKESEGKTGLGVYPDGMVEHDGHVGQLLAKLEELGIADNTIVMWSTDNGAEELSWPDGGTTPFRGEKDTNWEGGWRVPCAIRWPGVIRPGTVSNEIFSHHDVLPTLLAAAGEPDIVEKVKKGHHAGAKTFKVHLDGYNLIPFLTGEVKENPRPGILYWSDEGDLMALRYGDWKVHFKEQRTEGFGVWEEPLVPLRGPKLVNLRSDPFERADQCADLSYKKWRLNHVYMLMPAAAIVMQWMKTLQEFPPRQKPASFSVGDVMAKLEQNKQALAAASK